MKSRRFFATVWRVNALVIFVAGVLAFFALVFGCWQILKDMTLTRQASDVVNIADEQLDRSKAQIGSFEAIEGTNVFRAPLVIEQEYGLSSGSKETRSTENYFFYDSTTGNGYWLKPKGKGLILSTHELPGSEYGDGNKRPVIASVYEYVVADSDGDKRLTERDLKQIAISDPKGRRFTMLRDKVEEVNGTFLTSAGDIVILYTSGGTLRALVFGLQRFEIMKDAAVNSEK